MPAVCFTEGLETRDEYDWYCGTVTLRAGPLALLALRALCRVWRCGAAEGGLIEALVNGTCEGGLAEGPPKKV